MTRCLAPLVAIGITTVHSIPYRAILITRLLILIILFTFWDSLDLLTTHRRKLTSQRIFFWVRDIVVRIVDVLR